MKARTAKKMMSLLMISILIIILIQFMTYPVLAERAVIGAQTYHTTRYDLNKGDIIRWDWEVVGRGWMDFCIEDEDGKMYSALNNSRSSDGIFIIPKSGEWSINLYNPSSDSQSVTMDYTFKVEYKDALHNPLQIVILSVMVTVFVSIMVSIILARRGAKKRKQESDSKKSPKTKE
jgi:ABC-type sugar transport system permease subunit